MFFGDIMEVVGKFLWGIATSLIIGSGIFFTFKLKGVQFKFKRMYNSVFGKSSSKGISSLQTLMVTLAGRIGVGSIAGVSLAIYYGGPGSIFWMLITVFLCATTTFCETLLGGIYKEQDIGYEYKGGPSYYIKKGLSNKPLSILYSILIIVGYIGFFIAIQSNTIVKSLPNINIYIIAIFLAIFTFIIIYGGLKKIASFSSVIVPIMTLIYVAAAIFVIIVNINIIPTVFLDILTDAFDVKSFFSGFISGIIIGLQRGIFANESGIGTGSIISSSSASHDLIRQSYLQMLGIYITSFLICVSTAIIVLTSDYMTLQYKDINGIELTQHAFIYHFGTFGNIILTLSIILFSFSTVVTAYYYGESCLKFFGDVSPRKILTLKLATVIVVFIGCLVSSYFLWSFVDIIVAVLIIINIYSIIKLRNEIIVYVNKNE